MERCGTLGAFVMVACIGGVLSLICEPDCSGTIAGDLVANPNNCQEFYVCMSDDLASDHPIPCDSGYSFDTVTHHCVPVGSETCDTSCQVGGSCDPDCTGKNPGDFVANPLSCSEYYICLEDETHTDHPLPCDPGLAFDIYSGTCLPESTVDCDASSCLDGTCEFKCQPNEELYSIANMCDCNKYHVCLHDGTVSDPVSCPANYVFNGNTCVEGDANCCITRYETSPWCGNGVIQAPDPNDCQSYYICLDGQISEDYHYHCGAGHHFDVLTEHCEVGPCPDYCHNGFPMTTFVPKSTTTMRPNTPGPDCFTSMNCYGEGHFASCTYCSPFYLECSANFGTVSTLQQCDDGLVFNTDPDYPYCVKPEYCPYHP